MDYDNGFTKAQKSYENQERPVEDCVHDILRYIGENPGREGLIETPHRVAKVYAEVFGGYSEDPKEILSKTFEEDEVTDIYNQGMVIVRDIQFYSHCEHHMVPFFGKAHIGYIPGTKVVGLSKLCRLVNCFAHRLQVQERLTKQIADAIVANLQPLGVMVVIEAEHLCMKMRGVKNPCADTVTSTVRGVFEKAEARNEFLQLVRR